VIRVDVRAFGESDVPTRDYALHDDLRAVLDAAGIERAGVVGVSMGGTIAIDFALAYPERISALVGVATGPNGYDRWSDEIRAKWNEEEAALDAGDVERAIEINLQMWVDGPRRKPDEVDADMRRRVSEMLAHNLPREGEGDSQDLEPSAIGRLAEIKVPTLVVIGDMDQPEMISASELLAAEIPGARKYVMAGVAHVPSMERPDEFNRVVLGFLDEVEAL
jgi:pimeloyl-ACP methyl ester carboxylesterase